MQADAPKIETDPNLGAEQQQAQSTLIQGLQTQAQGDTAALMARYGTRLALSGSGMAPVAPTATAPAVKF